MNRILLVLLLISTAIDAREPASDMTSKAMKKCAKSSNIPQSYIAKFNRFEFPNQVKVYHYLHCFWSELHFWNDKRGFDKHAVLIKNLPYTTKLIPIVERGNQGPQKYPPPKRVYLSYKCILDSSVGEELKEDMSRRLIG